MPTASRESARFDFAVAMSNASGSLNSLAASTVLDFSRLSGHQTDPAKFLRLSRL